MANSHKPSEIYLTFRDQFLENIKSLYQNEKLCDVTLIADEKRIPAHRVILSAATPYFAAMFTNDLQEKNQQEIILHEIHGHELKVLIDFCYTGIIDINETNVFELLETASRIEFTHIEDTCARFLRDKLNASNCLMTWAFTERLMNLKELTGMAVKLVEENFAEIAETHDFLLLDVNHLSRLLSSDGLNVYSEEEVFNALSKWVRYDQKNRKCHVKDLLKTIRFSQLKSKFLLGNVSKFCAEVKVLLKNQLPMSPRPSTTVNRLIAFGGFNSSSENRRAEIYYPTTNKWKIFKNIQCERDGFCSVILGEELYIFGGYSPKSKQFLNSVEKYNFSTKQLKKVESMSRDRFLHAATVLNDEIFVVGGVGLNSAEKFDPEAGKWTEIASMLQSREKFALVSLSGRIFAVGGRKNFSEYLNSVECYDPLKNKWEAVAPMNRTRCAHAVVVHKNRLFALGGFDGTINDSVEYYDPSIDKWTLIDTITIPRSGFGVVTSKDFVIVAGGAERDTKQNSSVIKIDLEKLVKQNISPMHHERSYFGFIEISCYNPDN